jgi:diketogulonate reductase-like aldo/keto reductase
LRYRLLGNSGLRVSEVAKVAREMGCSSARVALAWLLHRDVPVTPIIGARKIEQLKDNLASLELNFTACQRERLDMVSRIHMGFPHDFLNKELVQAFSFGGLKIRLMRHDLATAVSSQCTTVQGSNFT